jgi:hypothetical protein
MENKMKKETGRDFLEKEIVRVLDAMPVEVKSLEECSQNAIKQIVCKALSGNALDMLGKKFGVEGGVLSLFDFGHDFFGIIYLGDRNEFLDKCKSLGFDPDSAYVRKYGTLEDDNPKTQVCNDFAVEEDGFKCCICLSYYRDGLPTSRCRVEEEVVKKIVCDL